jgi:tripartite-type tricarboxylate transporter receptor subunit TctC
MIKKINLVAALATATLAIIATEPAMAQGYPNKPVTLVIPFSPGGGTDIVGRLIGQKLSVLWNQPVIIDNRAGANTLIGTDYVSRAAGDGYTLLMASPSHTINPSLYKKSIRFDAQKDFAGAALVATGPLVLVVNSTVPVKNVHDLIALAKAKPGTINYASAGTGSSPHLAGELFDNLAQVQMTHVPYKGTAPATTDLLGGQVQAAFSPLPGVLQYIKTGKLRALGLTSSKRFPELLDVPTIAESGVPGYEVVQWWGIIAPSSTPKDVLKKINADVAKILDSPGVKEELAKLGAEPGHGSPEQLDTLIRNEIVMWGKLIDSAKITAD